MSPTHVVLRSLDAGGKRVPGEMVDAREWRHVEYFVESRRLRPVMAGETGVECECGRLWTSIDQAVAHCGDPATIDTTPAEAATPVSAATVPASRPPLPDGGKRGR